MQVNESSENYLETILVLSKRNPVVRSVDIAEELGFKKSSVSVAMKNLREKNNITVTKEGYIYLTDSGREIAEMIYERHELLTDWLTRLGVDPKIAAEDACRMEHVISKESFDAIKKHIKYIYILVHHFHKQQSVHILNRSVITKTRGAHRNRFPEAPLVFLFILSAELYRCHLIRLFEQAVKMLHVLISHTRCNRLHRLI